MSNLLLLFVLMTLGAHQTKAQKSNTIEMATKPFKSVILGPPASGKGTISSRIVNTFNLQHISSGDKLRINIKNGTAIGREADGYVKVGKLVPDHVMIKFIADEIRQVGNRSWLLDGYPRTLAQAQKLWEIQPVDVAINLDVPFEVIIERVRGRWIHLPSGRVYNTDFNAPKVPGKDDVTGEDLVQRDDDRPEVVLERLKQYRKLAQPVVDFYRKVGVLREFQGRSSDEIWPKVLDCLATYIPVNITQQQNNGSKKLHQ